MSKRVSLRKHSKPWPAKASFGSLRIMQLFYLTQDIPGQPRMLFHKVTENTATILEPCESEAARKYQFFPAVYPVFVV